jgi:SAM-dependent methyltransferase
MWVKPESATRKVMRKIFQSPPLDLLQRTGNVGAVEPERAYDEIGKEIRHHIYYTLPQNWCWRGARVLDFGCGAGRVLRQFAVEAKEAEFWGCDIHAPSIEWVNENLNPPFHAVVCNEEPGLPFEDGHFSFIYAISVFTHLTEHATGWLLELHRVLADNGLLMLTFMGEHSMLALINEVWDDSQIGFNAVRHGPSWDYGGPLTFISHWWISEHWGRAFEIFSLHKPEVPGSHEIALLRKRSGHFSPHDIDRINPNDPREVKALQHNIRQLTKDFTVQRSTLENQVTRFREENDVLRDKIARERDVAIAEINQTISERDALAAASTRWFDAVIAVTPDHNPLAPASRRQHSRWRNLARRLNREHGRPSPMALADRARDAGKWELAVRYYRDAVDVEPDDPEIWVQLGHALKNAGKASEAEVAYQRSRQLTVKKGQLFLVQS